MNDVLMDEKELPEENEKYSKKEMIDIIIFLIISSLMIIIPYIRNLYVLHNTLETTGIVHNIRAYKDSDGDDRYYVDISYNVDGKIYPSTLLYGNVDNLKINNEVEIYYNKNNPKEFSSPNDNTAGLEFLVSMSGIILVFFPICFIIDYYLIKDKEKKRKLEKTFKEEFNSYKKYYFLVLLISIIIGSIPYMILKYKIFYRNTFLKKIQFIFLMYPVTFICLSITLICYLLYFKIIHKKTYNEIINEQYYKKIKGPNTELYFTEEGIVHINKSQYINKNKK